jgi:2-keto-4-pentenoate hydratase/2-oxohepta-3-ene-1,7-dioic acid hydratase in catechol pathway
MTKTFTSALPAAAAEAKESRPYLFAKACAMTGAFDDIVLPHGMARIDWEAELAVVIGRRGKHIPPEKAADHIAGYMTTNDVSCRDLTWREDRPWIRSDWLAGKSFDSFAPMGPYFTPKAFVPSHDNLRIRLWVNGAPKQDGMTRDMIFGIEDQIAYAAGMVTLEPGDIFSTGTPAGRDRNGSSSSRRVISSRRRSSSAAASAIASSPAIPATAAEDIKGKGGGPSLLAARVALTWAARARGGKAP